jgi:methionine-gamma-lyase
MDHDRPVSPPGANTTETAMGYSSYHKRRLMNRELHPETQMMSFGYDPFLSEGAVKPPVFLTSTFAFRTAEDGAAFFDVVAGRKPAPDDTGAGLVYSRFNHPNLEIVEDRLALIDGAESAIVTSSGMAAIGAVLLTFLRPGDQLVHSTPLYGGTETLIRKVLAEWGIGGQPFTDGLSPEQMEAALEAAAARGRVGLFYVETPANPTNALIDLKVAAEVLARFEQRHGYRPVSACDNTMLGPIFQHPIADGIDLCVYSLTKYVGGHSDLVAGGVTGRRSLIDRLRLTRSAFGSQLDPHSSWMIARSMETLVLRMRRAAATGSQVAHWLAGNPIRPVKVLHPQLIDDPRYQQVYRRQCRGAGSTFSFVLDGGRATAFRFINALSLFKSAVSLGGTESLICHPASTTHSGVPLEVREQVGVGEGLIRMSIGLEHEEDLIADLENALKQC